MPSVMLLWPLVAFYVVFFILPQILFLRDAFYRNTGPALVGGSPTFSTIREALSASYTIKALWTTLALCSLGTIISLVIGVVLADIAVHSRRWGPLVFGITVTVMLTNSVARALGWQVILSDNGPINRVLMDCGLVSAPLHLASSFTAVLVGTIDSTLPLAVIGLMPACASVPSGALEAAAGLGASATRAVTQIYLPHCGRALISVGMLIFAATSAAFTTPAILGGGHVPVLSLLIYTDMQQTLNYAEASALSLVLVAVVGAIVLVGLSASMLLGRRRSAT